LGQLLSFKVFFSVGLFLFSFFIPKIIKKTQERISKSVINPPNVPSPPAYRQAGMWEKGLFYFPSLEGGDTGEGEEGGIPSLVKRG